MKQLRSYKSIFLLIAGAWLLVVWFVLSSQIQADWLVWQGNIAYGKAGFGDAEVAYKKATSLHSDRGNELAYNLGNSLYRQGRVKEALGHYQKQLKIHDSKINQKTWFNAGIAYFATQDTLKSLEAFKQALLLKPNDAQTRQNFLFIWKAWQTSQQKRKSPKKEAKNGRENKPETQAKEGKEEEGKPGTERQEENVELSDKNIEDLLSQIRKNEEAARGKINKSKQVNQKVPPGELDY